MKGRPQESNEIIIKAPPERVWAILQDTTQLPNFAPMVEKTTGVREALGAVRECEVRLNGRHGRVRERCVEFEPFTRIGWELMEDTFGFSRFLKEFSFDFALEPLGDAATCVSNTTYYTPKSLLGFLMSALILRRKFAQIRSRLLGNLKAVSEEQPPSGPHAGAAPASASVP